jgi:hypothetical protein
MMGSLPRLVLIGFVAACGTVKPGQLPDAPPPDAPIDAITRGTVKATVLDPGGTGAPAVGATVVFLDPDGTLVKRIATDAMGKANADLLPGGSVTSIALINNSSQIQTVLAVKPGDDLVLGIRNTDFTAAGTFTVNYPTFAGAASYQIAGPCGVVFVSAPAAGTPPPTTATLSMDNSCKQNTMEIVVTPNDSTGTPIVGLSKSGVAFTNGGSTTLTGAYQSLRSFTASYTNINSIVASMFMSRGAPDASGIVTSLSAAPPTASQVLNTSGAAASTARVTTRFTLATRSFQEVRQNLSGSAATYGLDATANLLPWINQPSFDAASGKLVIPLDMTGTSNAQPDLFRTVASYRRTDANNVTTAFSWTLFSPQAGDVVLPHLPSEVSNVLPTSTDTVTVTAAMVEMDTVTGYDAIRNDLNGAVVLYGSIHAPASTVRLSLSPLILR